MSESESSDKTEPASDYKLSEAKKKGNIWKSQDLLSVVMIAGALLVMGNTVKELLVDSKTVYRKALTESGQPLSNMDVMNMSHDLISAVFISVTPALLFVVVIAIAVNLLQTGFVFSFEIIRPQFERLDPIKGAKKLFSMQKLYDLAKTSFKILVISLIVIFFISSNIENIISFSHVSPANHVLMILELVNKLTVQIILPLTLVAVLDIYYSRNKYMTEQKMSKYEVKEEYKRKEGDPQVRSKRKEMSEELKKRGKTLSRVPEADVVITNPTHLAVLLKYDSSVMVAPKITGLASDEFALKIMEKARQNGVPIVRNIPLARALFTQSIDHYVAPESFSEVAKLYKELNQ